MSKKWKLKLNLLGKRTREEEREEQRNEQFNLKLIRHDTHFHGFRALPVLHVLTALILELKQIPMEQAQNPTALPVSFLRTTKFSGSDQKIPTINQTEEQ